ncbi:late embryogenesis abundant protein At1g64065-like [Abrus precatorius]|uniref:Late embryogenesis abundant protein At1g64065-like n=1 Tax=Abrus precatorius TaxID=3816 RepID=A0A8B8K2X9_ABRPR|nr:late embryogenesis abundant protein At1g64065-like [Abrus precatorius]
MAETDQARPLAPATDHSSDDEEALKSKHRRRIKVCGCVTATLLLLVIVIVILIFTVLKVKDPKLTTNEITLTTLDISINNAIPPQVKVNMSMLVDMSIKNPNAASFKFNENSTTTIFYHGTSIAAVKIPSGLAKARRTLRMNATVDIMADRLANSSPDLVKDVRKGEMTMNSYSVIPGRVKVLFVKKHVEIRMNCTLTINISSREVQDMACQRKVKL